MFPPRCPLFTAANLSVGGKRSSRPLSSASFTKQPLWSGARIRMIMWTPVYQQAPLQLQRTAAAVWAPLPFMCVHIRCWSQTACQSDWKNHRSSSKIIWTNFSNLPLSVLNRTDNTDPNVRCLAGSWRWLAAPWLLPCLWQPYSISLHELTPAPPPDTGLIAAWCLIKEQFLFIFQAVVCWDPSAARLCFNVHL